jgi:tRNA A-37 threonylcarbamoyl transferase component Bud32
MTGIPSHVPETFALPLSQASALDDLADEFERLLWQGKAPSTNEFLDRAPPETRAALREELDAIAAEMRANGRLSSGEPSAEGPGRVSPRLGEYELLELLGQGGMGAVYKARHRRLGQVVALKQIRPDRPIGPTQRERFEREIQIVGRMQHPHLVEALYAGEEAGTLFLVMRHVEGIDLQRLVQQRGPLEVNQASALVLQAALGLQYIGQQGLVHRDIKPSNLMLTAQGTVKVLDLGLARLCEQGTDLTGSGMTVGTPDYLAPEQARSASRTSITADLYSLGCVLFFLLTGRPPFAHREGMYDKLKAHAEEPPPDVRSQRPEVPATLAELLARLLAKDPAERPQQPAEVAAVLEPLTAGADLDALLVPPSQERVAVEMATTVDRAPTTGPQTPPSTPVGPVPQAAQTARRRRVWPLLAGGVMAAGLLLALGLMLNGRDQKPSSVPPARKARRNTPVRKLAPAVPLITRFEVKHYARAVGGGLNQPRGVLGEKSYAVPWNDLVQLHVELSRPAPLYLLAFYANGKQELLWPEKEEQTPRPLPRLDYPTEEDGAIPLNDEPRGGVQAFVLVVGKGSLPAYASWRKNQSALTWQRIPVAGQEELVWRGNGQWLDELFPGGVRAKKETLAGVGSLRRLARLLRQSPGVAEVSLLAFPVWPR